MNTHSTPPTAFAATVIAFYGIGFALFLLSFLQPELFRVAPWLAWLVDLWGLALFAGVIFIANRLRKNDEETAIRRKNRYQKGWQGVEARKSHGQSVRSAGYQRHQMLADAQVAQERALREARERQGVDVQFRPQRDDVS